MTAVTALVPVKHYHERFLRLALDSVRNQSSPDWELIVIGDEHNERSLLSFLRSDLRDPRVTYIRRTGARLAGALNSGMRAASTEFAAILLGDDLWAPNAVEVLNAAIREHPGADFFHSGRAFVDHRGRPISAGYVPRGNVTVRAADFKRASPVKHLLCWRRDLALSFGGMDETLPPIGTDDFDFPWTMAEHGARFHAVGECLYLAREHREAYRLTTHVPLNVCVRGLRRIMRKHGQGRVRTELRILQARRTYLRQCLYRSELHARLSRRNPRSGWREPYA